MSEGAAAAPRIGVPPKRDDEQAPSAKAAHKVALVIKIDRVIIIPVMLDRKGELPSSPLRSRYLNGYLNGK